MQLVVAKMDSLDMRGIAALTVLGGVTGRASTIRASGLLAAQSNTVEFYFSLKP